MKKIIAIALIAVFVLALASCAPAIKEPDQRVEAKEFYEQLRASLDLDKEFVFEENISVKMSETSKSTYTTEYDNDNSIKEKQIMFGNTTAKYSKDDGILSLKTSIYGFADGKDGDLFISQKEDDVYVQDGSSVLAFENLKDTYTTENDAANGVQEKANDEMESVFEEAFGEAIIYSTLKSDVSDSLSGGILGGILGDAVADAYENMFGDDVKVEYYIDGNVYTVIYHEASDNKDDADRDYDKIVEKQIKVQIVANGDKVTVVREETETTTFKYKSYKTIETVEETCELEFNYKDVNVKKPNTDKYANIDG